MNKHKILISALIIGVIIVSAGIILNSRDAGMEIIDSKDSTESTDYTPVYKDEVTEYTATLGHIIDNVQNKDKNEILDGTNILNADDNGQNITRFQLATILYNIIVDEGKLPSNIPMNISFEDNSDIPTKYFNAVAITSNLGILQYQNKFDGYKYVTEDEVDEAFNRLNTYLNNWTSTGDNTDNTDNTDGITSNISGITDELIIEAAEILENRDTEDKLSDSSVAVYENPKTIHELIANINSIEKVDITDQSLISKYEEGKRVDFDYINIDEGILNGDKFKNLSIDEDPNYFIDDINIMGMTVTESISFNYNIIDDTLLLFDEDILGKLAIFNIEPTKCFGIKDYKIVSSGNWYIDSLDPLIALDAVSIDSLGILVNKDVLEGEHIFDEDKSNNYILVIVPLGTVIKI